MPARLAVVASYRLCITTSGDDLCPYLQSRRVGPRTTPAAMMNDRTRRFGKDPRVSESTVPGAGDCRHTAGVSRTRCAGRPSPGPGEDARVVCASARLHALHTRFHEGWRAKRAEPNTDPRAAFRIRLRGMVFRRRPSCRPCSSLSCLRSRYTWGFSLGRSGEQKSLAVAAVAAFHRPRTSS